MFLNLAVSGLLLAPAATAREVARPCPADGKFFIHSTLLRLAVLVSGLVFFITLTAETLFYFVLRCHSSNLSLIGNIFHFLVA